MDVLQFPTADTPPVTDTRPVTDTLPVTRNFAGLDAVRAFAALGVVLLHSGVPYLENPMPGLAWPIRDASSQLVDVSFWWIELFIMPLFLTVAGFFAWRSLARRSGWALVKCRARRLLAPLLFGIVVILPLDLYCWVLGWVAEGLVAPIKLKSLKFDAAIDRELWGLSHLWFLPYLFLYVVTVATVASLRSRFDALRRFSPSPQILIAAILAIGTIVLYFRPEVVWGFQHSFFPVASKWVYSGLFFAAGAMLAALDDELIGLKRVADRLIAPAIVFSACAVLLGRWHLDGGRNQFAEITLAGLTCVSAMLLTMAIIGTAVKRVHRVPIVVQYLAAASFWIYLVHHPILGLVHIDLKWLLPGAAPAAKYLLAFGLTAAASVLSYEGLVRQTRLGRWLGFNWQPTAANSEDGGVIATDAFSGRNTAIDQSSTEPRRKAA